MAEGPVPWRTPYPQIIDRPQEETDQSMPMIGTKNCGL